MSSTLPVRFRHLSLALAAALAAGCARASTDRPQPSGPPPGSADAWWAHIARLADDSMRGREAGSPEHREAADYVAARFAEAGLEPAGANGTFLQPVRFTTRRIVEQQSSLALVRNGTPEPLVLGEHATIGVRISPAPELEAPLVFVGYGLVVPTVGRNDLEGMDLKGKVVVYLSGAPADIPAATSAHFQSTRWMSMRDAGAVGTIEIRNPRANDVPWERYKLARFNQQVTLADETLEENHGQRLQATFNPAHADLLFAGTGHTIAEVMQLAGANRPLPRFEIPVSVRSRVAATTSGIESHNVAGLLRGADERLREEYVVVSAHLDHTGVGRPIAGDSIYNGAMDNASGIATLIETARAIVSGPRPKRSIVFVAVTAEEKGLLGSKYYAGRPTVPAAKVVANLNTDMFLPLVPFTGVIANGLEESDLADDLRRVGSALGVRVLTDPEPERRSFVRSDQYSFIKRGVPALSLKVGFDRDTPEHEVIKRWRAERYHAPSDDLSQPVNRETAVAFNRLYARLLTEVANRPTRPRWNSDSFFRIFAVE